MEVVWHILLCIQWHFALTSSLHWLSNLLKNFNIVCAHSKYVVTMNFYPSCHCFYFSLMLVYNIGKSEKCVCCKHMCHIVVILFSRVPIANSYMHQSTWIDKDIHKYLLHDLVHIWSAFFSKHDRLLFILKRSFSLYAFWCHGFNLKC